MNQYNPGPYGPAPQNGSAAPAYYPSWQQDPSTSTVGASSGPPHLFNHISAMDPYKGASPEELRAVDYQQGRKTAGTAGGFGQPAAATTSTFGQPAQTTNAFGAPAQNNTFGAPKPGGLFGSSTPATSGFGQTSGGFGASSSTTTGGLFGQPQQQQQQQAGGLFGANNTNATGTTGGIFGQPQQQPATAGTGLFGSTNNAFGGQQQNQQQGSTFGSGFGATQNKPAFGAAPTSGFGTTNTASTTTGGGLFGGGTNNSSFSFGQNNQQQNQQQQQQQPGGLFGGSTLGQPQQNTGTSLFGANNQTQPAASGGLFGANNAAKPGGLFGSTTGTTAPSTGFSFGQNNQQQQQPAAGTSLFGATNNAAQPAAGGGLFGSTQPQQPGQQPGQAGGLFGASNTGSSLFGAKPATTGTTGGGLFGSTTQQPATGQTGGLFGGSTTGTGTGLFGSTGSTGLGFGANQQQTQQKPGGLFGGGGMFGNTQQQQAAPAATGTGLFGGSLSQSQNAGTGLFGGTTQQPASQSTMGNSLFGGGLNQSQAQNQQQPTLTASMADFPYGNSDLFKWNGQTLGLSPSTKKPALPPMTSSFRITPKSSVSRLRGFSSPLQSSLTPSRRAQSPLATPGKGSSRYAGLTDADLGPNAFVPRQNIKKLTVTPKTNGIADSEDKLESVLGKSLLRRETPKSNGSTDAPQTTAKSTNGTTANGNLSASTNGSPMTSTPSRAPATLNRSLMQSTSDRHSKKGEYWCRPRLEKLKMLSDRDLKELHHFTVGRRGFGEVTWLEPVDLTGLDLNELLGAVVVFSRMELTVYANDYALSKPEQGEGLNQPARITLENCWPEDKATRQPDTNPSGPAHDRFLQRVKNVRGTEFIGYTDDGTWTFEVGHFSRWGIAADSEDEDEDGSHNSAAVKQRTATRSSAMDRTPSRTPESGSGSADEDDLLPPTKGLRDDESAGSHDSGLDDEDNEAMDDEEEEEDGDGTDDSHTTSGSAASRGAKSTSYQEAEPSPTVPGWEDALQRNLGASGLAKLREMRRGFGSFVEGKRTPARRPGGLDPDFGLGRLISKQMEAEEEYATAKRQREEDGQGFGSAGEEQAVDSRAVKRASFGEKQRNTQPSMRGKEVEKEKVRKEGVPRAEVEAEQVASLREPRKYRRVLLQEKGALEEGDEGINADAGLALGRSWRATWGPNGELVHLGSICGPAKSM